MTTRKSRRLDPHVILVVNENVILMRPIHWNLNLDCVPASAVLKKCDPLYPITISSFDDFSGAKLGSAYREFIDKILNIISDGFVAGKCVNGRAHLTNFAINRCDRLPAHQWVGRALASGDKDES